MHYEGWAVSGDNFFVVPGGTGAGRLMGFGFWPGFIPGRV